MTNTYDVGLNGIGHLTSLTDQAGSGIYTYDVMGRIKTEQRTISGITKSISYGYDLAGFPTQITYPSTRVVNYTADSAGRAISAIDGDLTGYATAASYNAAGTLAGFVSGSSITNSFLYNPRLQLCRMITWTSGSVPASCTDSAVHGNLMDRGYNFGFGSGDNGNVLGITNYRDTSRSQSFTYDSLNRLISAQNAGTNCAATTVNGKTEYWGNNYGYDAWGNLTAKSVTKCSAENMSLTALANNQLSGYGYDAAGNMTSDPTDNVSSAYDAENRIATASTPQGIFTYTYDADGNRVEKSGGGTSTLYWYMTPGIVAESDLSGNLKSEYVFFNGERVARRDYPTGAVMYYFSDHLKTASIVTDSAGNIKSESDYYPWGGELQFVNNDSNHYKFTGKERDSESGLDYFGARYYSNGLGRFITPDWSAKAIDVPYAEFSDPQSLNLYSYVRNIPTTSFDADGHDGLSITAIWGELSGDFGFTGTSSTLWGAGSVVLPGLIGGGIGYAGINIYASGTQTQADAEMQYQVAINKLGVLINEMARKGKSTEQLRKEWEKLTGQKWPKDPDGRNQDAHHKDPKADGGADAGSNIEPKTHADHLNHHKKNGDFKRWGKRAHQKPEPPKPEPPKPDPPKPPNPEPPKETN